jgi:hypothetical protein
MYAGGGGGGRGGPENGAADIIFAVTFSPLIESDISVWQTGHRMRRVFDCGFTRSRLLQLGQLISAIRKSLTYEAGKIYLCLAAACHPPFHFASI